MSFSVNFPLFSVVASLLCAVISAVLPGKAARKLSLVLTGLVCVSSAVLFAYILPLGENVDYLMGHYPHPWGNELRISILEPLFSMVFSAVLFLCLLGGRKHLREDLEPDKSNLYYIMADLVQSSLLVLVYTNDIFTGYVFIEICTLASCGLLMIRQWGRTTLASVRYMIFSLVGSGMFLLGVVLLYNVTGQLLMPNLRLSISARWPRDLYITPITAAICLMTVGLAIKSGLFPFHFWMPDTYGFSTPSSAGILSGLISKGYIFFLIKIAEEPSECLGTFILNLIGSCLTLFRQGDQGCSAIARINVSFNVAVRFQLVDGFRNAGRIDHHRFGEFSLTDAFRALIEDGQDPLTRQTARMMGSFRPHMRLWHLTFRRHVMHVRMTRTSACHRSFIFMTHPLHCAADSSEFFKQFDINILFHNSSFISLVPNIM